MIQTMPFVKVIAARICIYAYMCPPLCAQRKRGLNFGAGPPRASCVATLVGIYLIVALVLVLALALVVAVVVGPKWRVKKNQANIQPAERAISKPNRINFQHWSIGQWWKIIRSVFQPLISDTKFSIPLGGVHSTTSQRRTIQITKPNGSVGASFGWNSAAPRPKFIFYPSSLRSSTIGNCGG